MLEGSQGAIKTIDCLFLFNYLSFEVILRSLALSHPYLETLDLRGLLISLTLQFQKLLLMPRSHPFDLALLRDHRCLLQLLDLLQEEFHLSFQALLILFELKYLLPKVIQLLYRYQ